MLRMISIYFLALMCLFVVALSTVDHNTTNGQAFQVTEMLDSAKVQQRLETILSAVD